MVLFAVILVAGIASVLLIQVLDVECVNPPKPRKVAKHTAQGAFQVPAFKVQV